MDPNKPNGSKELYLIQTPKKIEVLMNEVINRRNADRELSCEMLEQLQDLEASSKKFNMNDVTHIAQTLLTMVKSGYLPLYMERAFLHLLDEILLILQTPTQIQYRLPKIKDEQVLQLVKEYNHKDHPKTLLIIEDDLLFLNKIARLLSEAGFNVLKSHRGNLGLQIIDETLPDCILFGVDLVDITIEELIEKLKRKVSDFFVPIIAIGDKNQTKLIEKIKFETDDSLLKPFIMDDLFLKVMRLTDKALRMKNQVNIDELTGIYSRKFMMERLEYYLSNHNEKQFVHSVAIFDLDYFKHVNDKYGHSVGDKVLVEFTKFIRGKIRNTDIFARYGGEEFILLMPRTEEKNAWKKLNSLRKEFSNLHIKVGDKVIQQTFSGGIASAQANINNPVEILNLADIALYVAKNNGRNRVFIYEPKMKLKKQQSKILIVDDDRFTRQILLDGLNEEEWSLLEATNGREALEIAKREHPKLILLDGLMPEMNGYDVLVEIRQNIRFKQTAIIMLTANQSEENIAKALDAGADDYITKPFSLIELKARINRFLVR
ncbi:hypothetical protein BKP45_00900 [Anaerobacillus alkalidiazotrophicus]|uniref:Diguanylate cyclase n=1 Tax=Anaerobacillus alkalidiazotrophicus TaxID=472963 RepID=A0A1S2M9L9_9BACI|nr:diguanylate cyclase [Anaerobacillus alkalidiazotrophicus]OIJ21369.1 hypothetical protein BKP45_00900 [Anaerobacillus alkalidiazotrophicus]